MARRPRIHAPGAFYHVILRGNAGADIFHSNDDRRRFEALVAEGVQRFEHVIHAYCWMTNHVHLAVQVGTIPLSRIIQNLAFRHARWVNKRQERSGHLFEGRYKAILVDADRYLLALVRYIHLNPVRAGLVQTPEKYPWSSHRAYLGRDRVPWLRTSFVLGYFGRGPAGSRRRYAAFMREAQEEVPSAGPELSVPAQDAWGDERSSLPERSPAAPVARGSGIERIVIEVRKMFGVSENQLLGPSRERRLARARQVVAYLTLSTGSGTLAEVSRRINRDMATLSNGVRRLEERCRRDKRAGVFLEEMKSLIDMELRDGELGVGRPARKENKESLTPI